MISWMWLGMAGSFSMISRPSQTTPIVTWKPGGNSGEVVALDEVPVVLEASQSSSHPLHGVSLDDPHVAQAVALALLHHQALFHQLLEGVAHGGLVRA